MAKSLNDKFPGSQSQSCSQCEVEISEDTKFCSHCGAKIRKSSVPLKLPDWIIVTLTTSLAFLGAVIIIKNQPDQAASVELTPSGPKFESAITERPPQLIQKSNPGEFTYDEYEYGNFQSLTREPPGKVKDEWEGVYLKEFVVYQDGVSGFSVYFVLAESDGTLTTKKGRAELKIYSESGVELHKLEKRFNKSAFKQFQRFGGSVLAYRFERVNWFELQQLPRNGSECRIELKVFRDGGQSWWENTSKMFRAEY